MKTSTKCSSRHQKSSSSFTIMIQDNISIDKFTQPAFSSLVTQVEQFSNVLIDNATHIAKNNCEMGATLEVTSSDVLQAAKSKQKTKRKPIFYICKVGYAIITFIAGIAADLEFMQASTLNLFVSLIIIILAITATVLECIFDN